MKEEYKILKKLIVKNIFHTVHNVLCIVWAEVDQWCWSGIVLMMEAVSTSDTLVNFYQTTWCNIQEDGHLQEMIQNKFEKHYLGVPITEILHLDVCKESGMCVYFLAYFSFLREERRLKRSPCCLCSLHPFNFVTSSRFSWTLCNWKLPNLILFDFLLQSVITREMQELVS
jgi:hypothetical protein